MKVSRNSSLAYGLPSACSDPSWQRTAYQILVGLIKRSQPSTKCNDPVQGVAAKDRVCAM